MGTQCSVHIHPHRSIQYIQKETKIFKNILEKKGRMKRIGRKEGDWKEGKKKSMNEGRAGRKRECCFTELVVLLSATIPFHYCMIVNTISIESEGTLFIMRCPSSISVRKFI